MFKLGWYIMCFTFTVAYVIEGMYLLAAIYAWATYLSLPPKERI